MTANHKRNQLGEIVTEEKVLTVKDWEQRWTEGKTRFHVPRVHPTLQRHLSLLQNERTSPLSFFFPMCGKSLDMKWLAMQGHRVAGVEVITQGCVEFFQENGIPYSKTPVNTIEGYIYQSTDPNLDVTLYCCDFFAVPSGLFPPPDCIFDRGSFAAMHPETRARYASVMSVICGPNTRYLLVTFTFDDSRFAGPPFPCTPEQIETWFGADFSIELVGERDATTAWQKDDWGVDVFIEQAHLLTLSTTRL